MAVNNAKFPVENRQTLEIVADGEFVGHPLLQFQTC
jgi:hypothetical protein